MFTNVSNTCVIIVSRSEFYTENNRLYDVGCLGVQGIYCHHFFVKKESVEKSVKCIREELTGFGCCYTYVQTLDDSGDFPIYNGELEPISLLKAYLAPTLFLGTVLYAVFHGLHAVFGG